jgi:glycosyltransferase involved in cell wall biosynthesis
MNKTSTQAIFFAIAYFFCVCANTSCINADNKDIIVVIPSYNNSSWYERNISSLLSQSYTNWLAVYVDDNSQDGTAQAVYEYVNAHRAQDKIIIIRANERRGALYNLYHVIHNCSDQAVIVTLDGDDWFAHERVLEIINKTYSDPQVWMTYGTYQTFPEGGLGGDYCLPQEVISNNSFRSYYWCSTHLRTFYAGLFKKIRLEDLTYQGKFFDVTWDMAFMFPMLEMAGKHSRHIPEVLYVYNTSNPINDYKIKLPLVLAAEKYIRSLAPYNPLSILL